MIVYFNSFNKLNNFQASNTFQNQNYTPVTPAAHVQPPPAPIRTRRPRAPKQLSNPAPPFSQSQYQHQMPAPNQYIITRAPMNPQTQVRLIKLIFIDFNA